MKILIFFFISIIICEEFVYAPSDIINYINNKIEYTEEDYSSFIDNLIKTFSDSYAFYDISKNPPQPDFNSNYHEKVDIEKELKGIDLTDITPYEFYRKVWTILSKLKDQHIQLKWEPLNLDQFFVLGPIDYSLKEDEDGKPKIFGECLDSQLEDFERGSDISDICQYYTNTPITSINGMDPFDYINNFGGNFLSTKNTHGTFSFKLRYHNNVPLSDYPLSEEELQNYEVEFDSGESFSTEYLITSDIDIDEERLRNLNSGKKIHKKKIYKGKNNNLSKRKNFREIPINNKKLLNANIYWNYQCEDILKCFADENNEINIYYISSFQPSDKNKFNKTIENCYKLFDENIYPIIVINDLNNGGYVSLSQIFLGIISPLIPINLYKGRIRISESFSDTKDINDYINTNLSKLEDCRNCTYKDLIDGKNNVNYGNNIQSELTDLFYINNISMYNDIERARAQMNNKRKPSEILIYTDGYSFSAASLFLKYLKDNGGGIIVQYLGNPQKSEEKFDISQSPSPVFNSEILKIFSSENYNKLLSEKECELQIPGIQTFYNSEVINTPLEYEVSLPDEKSEIYEIFDENSYDKFVNKAKEIFEKYKTECNKENKNLLKITEKCDGKFGNNYTHGGYECGNDGKWTNECIPSYCDFGYTFDKAKKKCIIDECSLYDVPSPSESEEEKEEEEMGNGKKEEEEEIGNGEKEEEEEIDGKKDKLYSPKKNKKKSNLVFYIFLPIALVLFLSLIIYIIYYRMNYAKNNNNNYSKKEIYSHNSDNEITNNNNISKNPLQFPN